MTPKEALKGIKLSIAKHLHEQTGVSVEKHFEYLQNDTEIDIVDKALTEFEKLKERDTPMKLTQASRFTTDTKLYGMYACNSCHGVIPYIIFNSKRLKPKFCYHCGQKLDWEIEK